MKKSGAMLNEVIESSYANKPKKAAKLPGEQGYKSEIRAKPVSPLLPTAPPGFDQYLKDNQVALRDANGNLATGEVLLSFVINEKGRPVNIKVIRSSCSRCEQEAIKLLKNGQSGC
jgi:hypothetical protein